MAFPKLRGVYIYNEDDDIDCGIGACKPRWLQMFGKMSIFVGFYSVAALLTSTLSTYITSQITTLEKQFGLSSAQTGILLSCNDIGHLTFTLFASYLAARVHIPRVLSVSTALYGIAALITSSAYFVSKYSVKKISNRPFDSFENKSIIGSFGIGVEYLNLTSANTSSPSWWFSVPICSVNPVNPVETAGNCTFPTGKSSMGLPNEYSIIAMAIIGGSMVLQGVGKAPRYPLIATYIDNNAKKAKTPMFMGVMTGIAIFGPALAFACGGLFSRIYVTMEDVDINPRHPQWIGAWWLGFIVFGALSLASAVPLLIFPRRMRRSTTRLYIPTAKESRKTPRESGMNLKGTIKDVLNKFSRVITNPIYSCLVLGNCIMIFGLAGIWAFSAKYLELQFFLPTWKANILLGAVSIVSASVGTMIGGCLTTRLKLHPVTCIKLFIPLHVVITLLVTLGFVFGCSDPTIIGPNKHSNVVANTTDPIMSCGETCNCDPADYFSVCGSDNKNYFSPCYAGCAVAKQKVFLHCFCIGPNGTATPGLCPSECNMLIPFMMISVLSGLLGTLTMMPMFNVLIRCVDEKDKSFAIGLSAFLYNLVGWLPGPVAFGKIVDTSCLVWRTSCAGTGACALYSIDDLRVKRYTMEVIVRVIPLALFIFAFMKATKKKNWNMDEPTVDIQNTEMEVFVEKGKETEISSDRARSPIFVGKTI